MPASAIGSPPGGTSRSQDIALQRGERQPAASVPAGLTPNGLPVGLQIIGRRLDDRLVIAAAAALELIQPWAAMRPIHSVW